MSKRSTIIISTTAIFLALLIVGGVFWYQRTSQTNSTTTPTEQQATDSEYEKISFGYSGLYSFIPKDWAVLINDEHYCDADFNPANANCSFSPDAIVYTDISWRQVDICVSVKSLNENKDLYTQKYNLPLLGQWYKERLPKLNKEIDVFVHAHEQDGSISTSNTGGKDYFINADNNFILIIRKQAEGDSVYEEQIRYFLANLTQAI